MKNNIEHLREEYQEYPDDIVSRLLDGAEETGRPSVAALLIEAAKRIDDLRNGRGG